MDFNKLTKIEKVKYWKEIENNIHECLFLCDDLIPNNISKEINEYLNHNELGIALEGLAEVVIERNINISGEAKAYILNIFIKMNYHNDDKDKFYTYSEYLGEI